LDRLCERVTVGFVGKMADQYVDDGVPFLRSQNIQPFRIEENGILYITEDFHERIKKSALRAGDVAIVRTGYPGTAAVVPARLDGCNCADLVIITPSCDLNPHFLAAVFNSTWGISTSDQRSP
jgi:type I restriction enzyme, S subunit